MTIPSPNEQTTSPNAPRWSSLRRPSPSLQNTNLTQNPEPRNLPRRQTPSLQNPNLTQNTEPQNISRRNNIQSESSSSSSNPPQIKVPTQLISLFSPDSTQMSKTSPHIKTKPVQDSALPYQEYFTQIVENCIKKQADETLSLLTSEYRRDVKREANAIFDTWLHTELQKHPLDVRISNIVKTSINTLIHEEVSSTTDKTLQLHLNNLLKKSQSKLKFDLSKKYDELLHDIDREISEIRDIGGLNTQVQQIATTVNTFASDVTTLETKLDDMDGLNITGLQMELQAVE